MPYILKKYYPVRNIIFFLGEGLLIFLTINLVYLAFTGWEVFRQNLIANGARALSVTIIFQLALYFFDLYDMRRMGRAIETAVRMVQAFGFGCILLAGLYYSFPSLIISSRIYWVCFLVICYVLLLWRTLYYLILERRLFAQGVLMLGTGKIASAISKVIEENQDSGYKIAAFIGEKNDELFNPKEAPVLSPKEDLQHLCRDFRAERIIVGLDDRRGNMPVDALLECKVKGMEIQDGITFYEAITGKILVEKVNPAWLVFSDGFQVNRLTYFMKRSFDLTIALGIFFLALPIAVVTALLIKLDSPGPVFYTQERVGEGESTFKVIKFRSMRQDAEKNGPVWALKNDNRITRVGSFIRKTRIDELPQVINVFKGEMSFVGPRPERPVFVQRLTETIPYYRLRHSVKPGITGWAQVWYPYGASEEDALRKLEFDLYYIKNQSLFMDMLVIFHTIKTVLLRKGR